MKIGKDVILHYGLEVRDPFKITVGDNTIIGDNAILDGRNGLEIGRNVSFSSNVSVWTEQHDHRSPDFGCSPDKTPVIIQDRVWLGPHTTVLPCTIIGEGSVIAANAVVTKNVGPFIIAAGIPAKEIGKRTEQLVYQLHAECHFI